MAKNELQMIVDTLCPSILNMRKQKLALLLSVCSLDDYGRNRNRIHVLLNGKPGTAKSQLLRYVCEVLNYPYIEHRTSDAGLTGGLRSQGVLSRDRIVGIDEFDKLNDKDRDGTLEAMSRGKITITLDGQNITYNAPVRIIATCNSTAKMSPEQLDRFDFIFNIDLPDTEQMKLIGRNKLATWDIEDEKSAHTFKTLILDALNFRPAYKYDPAMDPIMEEYIDKYGVESPRQIDALIRTSLAIARILRRDVDVNVLKMARNVLPQWE